MNVLMICHDHPDITDGGTEHLAYDLCRILDAQPGVSATFLAVSTALSHPDAVPGELHRLGQDYLLRTGSYDMFAMRRTDGSAWIRSIETVLEQVEPEVVHLHGLDRIGAEIIAVLRRLRPDLKLVLTLHDYQLICAREGLLLLPDGGLCTRPGADNCRRCLPDLSAGAHALRKARLIALLHQIDHFIAPSEDLRDRFVAWGLPAQRIEIIPNAVPAMAPVAAPKRARPNRFAFFGNLATHKGIQVLLSAAGQLAQEGADLRVSLYGHRNHPTPDQEARFADQLEKAAPLAQYLGPYDRTEVQTLMAGTDWVVIPSLWFENAPLVLLEARRAGRPVICTPLGGMPELVRDGVDGVHVPRGDAATLAEVMQSLAEDSALWARLAGNVRPPPRLKTSARQHLSLYATSDETLPA